MTELLIFEEQHPSDELDHAVKFTNWMPSGDTLTSCTVTVSSGLTLGTGTKAPVIASANVILWLSGGQPGRTYDIQVVAETSQGRRKTVDGSITILDPTLP